MCNIYICNIYLYIYMQQLDVSAVATQAVKAFEFSFVIHMKLKESTWVHKKKDYNHYTYIRIEKKE